MQTKRITTILSLLLLAPSLTLAAETGTRQDSSDFLVWAFLGMCALIIIVQLMPVAILTYGLVKGLFKPKETPVEAKSAAGK